MLISEFLQNELGISVSQQDIAILDGLAGKEFFVTQFYETYEDAVKWLHEWMPLYVLPIGISSNPWIGLSLRPEDIASGQLSVVYIQETFNFTNIIECAPSLKAFVYRTLLIWNGQLNEGYVPLDEMEPFLALVREWFGDDFYSPIESEEFTENEQYKGMIDAGFGSALDYYKFSDQFYTPKVTEVLDKGLELHPDYLAIQTKWIKAKVEQGEVKVAAEQFVQSLGFYYHTLYFSHFEKVFLELGNDLFEQVPDVFPETARDALIKWKDPIVMFEDALKVYQQGDVAASVKHLNDFCFLLRDYDREPILQVLRQQYTELDWAWAVALVDVRLGRLAQVRQAESDIPDITPAVAEAWEPIIEKWVGLNETDTDTEA